MIVTLLSHRLLQGGASNSTNSTNATNATAVVTSTGVVVSGILKTAHSAMNALEVKVINIKYSGDSVPLTITGSNSSLLCLTMTNESDSGKVMWLYSNVVAKATSEIPPVIEFKGNTLYTDWGGATAVQSNFQKTNSMPAGYFGPINYNHLQTNQSPLSDYKINVYSLGSNTSAATETDALAACGSKIGSISFQSKYSLALGASLLAIAFSL